jgi:hypothetical protein
MSADVDASLLAGADKRLLATPYGFAKVFLGLPVYDGEERPALSRCIVDGQEQYQIEERPTWQRDVFDAMDATGARVSLRTANGSGKTSTIVAGLILWHLAVFPRGLVISTAGVDRQVRAQLWPNLQRFAGRCKWLKFSESSLTIENTLNGSRYVGFTTDRPERAEGWHGYDAEAAVAAGRIASLVEAQVGPLMIVVDEAKGVPRGIFEAFDRCTYQRLLYCSSPGLSDGDFYLSQTSKDAKFTRFIIGAKNCPHADHGKNAEIIKKRGADHPMVRSAIFAEFQSNEGNFILTAADLEKCINQPPPERAGATRAFADFAHGGDENVLAICRGNRVRIVDAWRESDSMAAAARFIFLFKREGLSPEEITGDNGGLGAVVIDYLSKLGWAINRANNGGAMDGNGEYQVPSAVKSYANYGSETWGAGAEAIRRRDFILENLDEETKAQLIGRKYSVNSRGQIMVESKEDMRKRGVDSPDRADALLGAMRVPSCINAKAVNFIGKTASDAAREALSEWARAKGGYVSSPEDGRDMDFLPGTFAG